MRINLTTPMSDDKERQRRTKAEIDAIEKYTEIQMTNENKYPSGGSGTGLQTVVCGKVAAAGTDRIGGAGVVMHSVVVDAQSDALRDQLLQECLVKLRDVQGTEAPKQYACNLIKRIERVLQGQSK